MQIGTLTLEMAANVARLSQDMARAKKVVEDATGGMTRAAETARKTLQGVAGALAGIGGARYLAGQIDEFTKFNAQLKLATDNPQAFAVAQNRVKAIASEAQASLAGIGTLYARIANGTAELGISQQKVGEITRSVALSLKVSGATAQESSSAILQLSQAFGSGVLRGEEFNAVNEASPRLMKALADGIGVPVGALRGLAEQGRLTSEVLAGALPKALKDLEVEARGMQTIGGAFQNLRNEVQLFIGQTAESSGVVAVLTGAIRLLADNLGVLIGLTATYAASRLTQALAAAATATWGQATATRAASLAALEKARADAVATGATLALTTARVAELRAAVMAASGATALTIVNNGLVPAQSRATAAAAAHAAALTAQASAASAASLASSVASRALGLLGGPIGAITTLVGLGVTAWMAWSSSTKAAEKTATDAVERSTTEIIADLEKQNAKMRERIELSRQLGVAIGTEATDAERRRAKLQGQIKDLSEGRGIDGGAPFPEAARVALMQTLLTQYGRLNEQIEDVKGNTGIQAKAKAEEALLEVRQRASGVNKTYLEDLAKYQAALAAGAISEANYVKEVSALATATYKKTDAEKAAKTAADAAAEASGKFIANLQKEVAMLGMGAVETKVYEASLLGITGKRLEEVRALAQQVEGDKALSAAQRESIAAYAETIEAQQKANASLQEQINKQQEYNAGLGLTKEAVTALEVAKLQEQAVSKDRLATLADEIDWTGQLGDAYRAQAAALRELAKLKEQGAAKEVVVEEGKAATAEWKKFTDQVNQSLTDSLMRAFESGGNFFKTFWKSVVNTLKTTVLKAVIQPVVGAMTGALGFGGSAMAGQAASAAGGAGGLLGSLSNVSSLYSAATAGYTAMMGAGVSALLGTAAGNAAIATAITGSASSAAAAATAAAQAAGTATAATGTLAGLGAGIATAMPWVLGGLAVAGLAKAAFGRGPKQVQAQGIEGNFTTSGASLRGFEEWSQKGGWFRSNKSGTNYSALDQGTTDFFSNSLIQVTAATKAYASILGLNADAINGITQSVRINLKGLDAAGREKAITDALGGFGNRLAEELLGTFSTVYDPIRGRKNRIVGYSARQVFNPGEFMREGETAAAALNRLATNLVTVNTVFDSLNVTLMRGSLIGADAAGKLLDLFGGAEKFGQATGAYYQAFYSESERTAIATRQLTEALGSMGLALPASRAAFRALVDSQNLYTDAGRATYTALIGLAPVFDQIKAASDASAEALKQGAETTRQLQAQILQERLGLEDQLLQLQGNTVEIRRRERESLDASNRALYDQIRALEDQKAAAEEIARASDVAADALKQLGNSLSDEVFRIRGLLITSGPQSLTALQSQFAIGTAAARAGDRGALERLPQISQALESAAALQAVTASDLAVVRGQLAASLEATMKALGLSVPQFAVGTNYVPHDMLAQIHEGEAIVPKAYNPAAGAGMGNNSDPALREEVRGLRAQVQELVRVMSKTEKNTGEMRDLVSRVTEGGTAMKTEVVA